MIYVMIEYGPSLTRQTFWGDRIQFIVFYVLHYHRHRHHHYRHYVRIRYK